MDLILDNRNKMAKRAAEEIADGMVVNLGIGIPSLVPNHLPSSINVMFQAENGILGMGASPLPGEEDENLCNAGGYPVTVVPGASYLDSTTAFGMIRRGTVDVSILGSLQVSRQGDLANWIIPGKKIPGMGGAMELASKAKKLVVLMKHTDKAGKSKVVEECTLPLTAKGCVNLIITDLAVFQVVNKKLFLIEHFSSTTVELIREKTDCNFFIGDNLKTIAY